MPIINGTNDSEDLQDTGGDDVINAFGGNDFIYLSDGFDDVRGGSGLDTLILSWLSSTGAVFNANGPSANLTEGGYDGSFSVTGGTRSVIYTSIEQFRIFAGSGDDIITAADGNDQLIGGAGSDILNGAGGNDGLDVGEGLDQANGGTGSDTLRFDYFLSTTAVTGGGLSVNGTDGGFDGSFTDGGGSRTVNFTSIEHFDITTGSGNDNIILGAGFHEARLGDGNDFLNLGAGRWSFLHGGDGEDGLSANRSGLFTVINIDLLNTATGISGFEYLGTVTASESNDFIGTGTAVRNETIHLGGGADFARVHDGADIVNGGLGDDTLVVDFSTAAAAISSAAPAANAGEGGFNGSYAVDASRSVVYTSITHIGLYGGSGGDDLRTAAGDDAIFGGAGDDFIDGGDGDDQLFGGDGNDNLVGGGAADHLEGGSGDDLYTVDSGDIIVESANGGRDGLLIAASGSYSLAALPNVEDLDGNLGNDTLTGNGADNRLRGNSGEDQLFGLGGNDNLFGQADNDRLEGGDGNDTLTGGAGRDVLLGGAGDDLFSIEQADDEAIEAIGGGNDVVRIGNIAGGFALLAGSEIETLETFSVNNTLAQDLTGNEFAQIIRGNNGLNILLGAGGDDSLFGFGGADTLDGGTGADSMSGGTGNDTYFVDDAGDSAIEAVGEGSDTVYTTVNYTLGAGQEIEVLSTASQAGVTALVLLGNGFDQTVYGNAGANYLDGGAGTDTLVGFGGDDSYVVDGNEDYVAEFAGGGNDTIYVRGSFSLGAGQEVETLAAFSQAGTAAIVIIGNGISQILYGNAGANYLDGGLGNDTLVGFGGDDSYVVDDTNDYVAEFAGGGNDIVYVRGSFSLGSGQEVETLAAFSQADTAGIVIVGNGIAQRLFGNAGNNYLDGGGGIDVLQGFGGNDTYLVDNAGDFIVEATGEGNDIVYALASFTLTAGQEIETLSTLSQAGTAALDLRGNAFANTIYANNGANILDGGGGNDFLQGFGGADSFQFTTAPGAANADTIADFVSGTDKLALDDAIFAGIGAPGSFNAAAFVTGTAATNAAHRIVYNSQTGQLFYDADGNGAGAAVLFATIQGNPVLAASDFQVI